MCFGGSGGGDFKMPNFNNAQGQNIIPIPAGNFVGGAAQGPTGTGQIPYQQGAQTGLMGAGNLQRGMGLAQQSYNNLGKMTQDFTTNAQHSGDANYNPGIGQFQDATRQNIANVASALASQRGTQADPGLAARNVGQAGVAAGQQAASQLGQVSAAYKSQQMGNALQAATQQGQMAGVYGQIAGAYAQMGLQNQASILQAIAAQNESAVQMQSNINNNRTAMFGQQLGYTANIFGSQSSMYNAALGAQSAANQQSGNTNNSIWGGLLGGLGAVFGLAEGGMVGRDGKPVKYAKGGSVKGRESIPKYANGGRIPEARRKKMAEGGMSLMPGEQAGIPDMVQRGPFQGQQYGTQENSNLGMGAFSPGGKQQITAMSRAGQFLQGASHGMGMGQGQPQMGIQQSNAYGQGAPSPITGFSRGGRAGYAGGGGVQPQMGPMRGPGSPNAALGGSPNPSIAMPPTGLPMGNSQTRGGGMMPSFGASGGANQGQMPQQGGPQQMMRPPGMAQGGPVRGRFPQGGVNQLQNPFAPQGPGRPQAYPSRPRRA